MSQTLKFGPGGKASSWENIGDIIDMSKPKAQEDIVVGKILTFNQEGSLHSYKVMKIPGNGNVWVRRVYLQDPGHYGHNVDQTPETIAEHGCGFCTDCGVPVTQPSKFET